MKKIIFSLIFVVVCTQLVVGQTQSDTCITHLKDAVADMDQGNYDDAILLLKSTILNCGLGKTDIVRTYELLIMCYISIDDLEDADITADKVLKVDPNYVPDRFNGDVRLIELFSKYRPTPVLKITLSSGVNIPLEKTVNSYSILFPDGEAPQSYKMKTGYQVGLQMEKRILNNFWGVLGIGIRNTTYDHVLYDFESSSINYSENLSYLDIPLSFKYYIRFHKMQSPRLLPYIESGFYYSHLTGALSTTTLNQQKDIVNRVPMRNTDYPGYLAGAGISYSIKGIRLSLNARYVFLPENVNKTGTRYNDPVNTFKYYYIDDDFRLNNFQLNMALSFNLSYKNIKVKH